MLTFSRLGRGFRYAISAKMGGSLPLSVCSDFFICLSLVRHGCYAALQKRRGVPVTTN
jgi:hypothetical protein